MRNLLFDGIPHTEFKYYKTFKFGTKYPEKRNSQRRCYRTPPPALLFPKSLQFQTARHTLRHNK